MESKALQGHRINIFRTIHDGISKFNDIKKMSGMKSNELSYHLKILASEALIEKSESNSYTLTPKGKNLYPYLLYISSQKSPVMVVTAVAAIKDGNIYLERKPREPDKGKLIFLGGKADISTPLEESAKSKVLEETGLRVKDLRLRCINEFIQKKEGLESHWVVYLYTATPIGKPNKNVVIVPIKDAKKLDLYGENTFFLDMLKNKSVKVTRTTIRSNSFDLHVYK